MARRANTAAPMQECTNARMQECKNARGNRISAFCKAFCVSQSAFCTSAFLHFCISQCVPHSACRMSAALLPIGYGHSVAQSVVLQDVDHGLALLLIDIDAEPQVAAQAIADADAVEPHVIDAIGRLDGDAR